VGVNEEESELDRRDAEQEEIREARSGD